MKSIKILNLLAITMAFAVTARAQTTAFTYQGRLNNGTNPATGSFDLTFTLFSVSSGAGQVGSPITNSATAVSNGVFTVLLDFGNQFPGSPRWLEIGVRTNGVGTFQTLIPRQQLTSIPYAVYAGSANATNLVGTVQSANLSGVALRAGGNAFTGNQTITSGNVGIGTVTPGAPLEVVSASTSVMKLSGPGGTLTQYRSTTGGQGWDVYIGTNNYAISRNGVDFPFVVDAATGNSVFNNRVGIGTGNPSALLHLVSGTDPTIKLQSDGVDEVSGRVSLRQSNDTGFDTYYDGFSAMDAYVFESFTGGVPTTKAMVLKLNGNVGIGTTNPATEKLVLAGGMDITAPAANAGNDAGLGLSFESYGGRIQSFQGRALALNPSGNNVGIGLTNPATRLHIVGNGDTELSIQSSDNNRRWTLQASGSTDGVGLGGTFQIVDRKAVASRFIITTNGNVGVGTSSPDGAFTVGTAHGTVTVANGAAVPEMIANGGSSSGHMRFRNALEVWPDIAAVNAGFLDVRGTDGNPDITLDGSNGNVSCVAVNLTSDRNAKEDFKPIDPREVLAKVASLPITEWQYKQQSDSRHIGPMAQDFSAAFELSHDDKHISVVDEGGVALAAIQGLNQKLDEKDARIQQLEKTVNELKALVNQLAEQQSRGAK